MMIHMKGTLSECTMASKHPCYRSTNSCWRVASPWYSTKRYYFTLKALNYPHYFDPAQQNDPIFQKTFRQAQTFCRLCQLSLKRILKTISYNITMGVLGKFRTKIIWWLILVKKDSKYSKMTKSGLFGPKKAKKANIEIFCNNKGQKFT